MKRLTTNKNLTLSIISIIFTIAIFVCILCNYIIFKVITCLKLSLRCAIKENVESIRRHPDLHTSRCLGSTETVNTEQRVFANNDIDLPYERGGFVAPFSLLSSTRAGNFRYGTQARTSHPFFPHIRFNRKSMREKKI